MKQIPNKQLVFIMLAALVITSCVPPTKFKSLQGEAMNCEEERELLKAENERLNVQVKETLSRLNALQTKMDRIGKDTLRWKNELSAQQRENSRLSNDYQDLYEANQALVKGSSDEIRRLMEDLQSAQKDMNARQSELEARRRELEQAQSELSARNARLSELEKVLKDQESAVSSLRQKVADALLGFESQGLTVSQRNGKVYVSLDEQLLFRSGSTIVDPKGVTALRNLSRVLEQNPDINIMIEGHTDDVPIVSGSVYKDNWDLSVLRSTAVVRILLDGSRIEPVRITTAGRSQFLPVDPARTSEARQKNRRTEIILSPKLDELYKLVEGI